MEDSLQKILYSSGDAFLPKGVRDFLDSGFYPDKTETFYINGWTGVHFILGIVTGFIFMRWFHSNKKYYFNLFIIHTLWESWQVLIGMAKPWTFSGSSNLLDSIVDTVVFILGGYIVKEYIS
jgi:hypothetical protein